MNIEWLRTYVTVVESGSFTLAAESLHLTQPAVSQQVGKLEQEFGVVLRESNSSRGIHWTPAGTRLYQMALSVLREVEQARLEFSSLAEAYRAPTVVVASGPTLLYHYLPSVLGRFWSKHPDILVRTRTVIEQNTLPMLLRHGEADLALHADIYRQESLPSIPFAESRLVPVCSPLHPLATQSRVRAEDIGHTKVALMPRGSGLRSLVEEWFAARAVPLLHVLDLATLDEIRSMATDAGTIGFTSEMVVRDDVALGRLKILPLEDFHVSRYLYVSHTTNPSAAALALLEFLRLGDAKMWPPTTAPLPVSSV